MRDVVLGRSGIRVSEMCLGTMTFGTSWGWGADEKTCAAIYAAYRDAGGSFLDAANLYTGGESEFILGRLVAGHRDEVTLATKFGMPSGGGGPNAAGASRKSLRSSVETSLRRLGTDHLDVLWLHAWDQGTALEVALRTLDDLVRAGKVLAIGVSNTPAWVVARSVAVAELRGWTAFCGLQVEYSPACIALAWVLSRGVLPVLGARTLAQLQDNIGAVGTALGEGHLAALETATAVAPGYPHDFLAQRRDVLQPNVLRPVTRSD